MTDLHDFEQLLRRDLAATAKTANPSPGAAERAITHALTTTRHAHRAGWAPRWLPPLAAAAVAAVGVSATVLTVQGRHSTRPADSSRPSAAAPTPTASTPAPSPSSTPTPRLPVVDGIHPASCTAGNADAFQRSLTRVSTDVPPGSYDSNGHPILSVTTDGDTLAAPKDFVPARLDLVTPSGQISTLYTAHNTPVGPGETAAISAAQGDATWIAFAVSAGAGQSEIRQLGIIERSSGAVTIIRTLPAMSGTIILGPVLFRDEVFWTEVGAGDADSVKRYDPATGSISTVGSGSGLSPLAVIGGGLYWQQDGQLVSYAAGHLPAGYSVRSGKPTQLVTDGTTTVWPTTAGSPPAMQVQVLLSRPNLRSPVIVTQLPADEIATPLAVVGPYVLWRSTDSIMVLDTRTGATANVAQGAPPPFDNAAAGGGVLAVNSLGPKGGAQLFVARLADLPELHC